MKRGTTWGTVLLALMLTGAGRAVPARHLFDSASKFVCHYRALEETNESAGFWERVAVSLVLTAAGTGDRQGPQT
jgi:hypothetical protein